MNFAPPNLRKFKLFRAAPAPIFLAYARLGKCYEVLIQEAAFFFQSQSQLFFFAPRASCTFGCEAEIAFVG
jgi:hypothetical protein